MDLEGGGSLNLEILRGGGAQAVFEIQVEGRGGSRNSAFCRGVWIFSGIITHCHLICKIIA